MSDQINEACQLSALVEHAQAYLDGRHSDPYVLVKVNGQWCPVRANIEGLIDGEHYNSVAIDYLPGDDAARLEDAFVTFYCLAGFILRVGTVDPAIEAVLRTNRFLYRDVFHRLTANYPEAAWDHMHGEPNPRKASACTDANAMRS